MPQEAIQAPARGQANAIAIPNVDFNAPSVLLIELEGGQGRREEGIDRYICPATN